MLEMSSWGKTIYLIEMLILLSCTMASAFQGKRLPSIIGKDLSCQIIGTINGESVKNIDEEVIINMGQAVGVSNNITLNGRDFATVSLVCEIEGAKTLMTHMTATKDSLTCSGWLQYFDPGQTRLWQNYDDRCWEVNKKRSADDTEYFNFSAKALDLEERGLQASCDNYFNIPLEVEDVDCSGWRLSQLFCCALVFIVLWTHYYR